MNPNQLDRQDIYLANKHSSLSAQTLKYALEDQVYPKQDAWRKFLQISLLVLGIGLTVAGIVFFFAYNWQDLNKFVKLGLVQVLVLLAIAIAFFLKVEPQLKKIILMAAGMLVGVMFAVFGQIYQTGADAFDFFLAWAIFVSLWVWIANYTPMWIAYIALIQICSILYLVQMVGGNLHIFPFFILIILSAIPMIAGILLNRNQPNKPVPIYFFNVFALEVWICSTIAIIISIFDRNVEYTTPLIILVGACYVFGIIYGIKNKSPFYISGFSLSIMVMIAALIVKNTESEVGYFLIGLLFVLGVTLVVKYILSLQKVKNNGNSK